MHVGVQRCEDPEHLQQNEEGLTLLGTETYCTHTVSKTVWGSHKNRPEKTKCRNTLLHI